MRRRLVIAIMMISLAACGGSEAATTTTAAEFEPTSTIATVPESPEPTLEPGEEPDTYWVTNPSSGSRLSVSVFYPQDWAGGTLPALLLVPGGSGLIDPKRAESLTEFGFLVITFDPEGRGSSEGVEDHNGYVGQDGLAAVAVAALELPGLDEEAFGMVSFSYGITNAAGALARHPDLPIDFLIDWEGPVDRWYTTSGCGPQANESRRIEWPSCTEDEWWSQREAITFVDEIAVPYQRVQSEKDHVQSENQHAVDAVNAAVAGGAPWVRLNDYPAGTTFDEVPSMLPESEDKRLEATIARYAWEIIDGVL